MLDIREFMLKVEGVCSAACAVETGRQRTVRKIEREMLEAIEDVRDWSKDNTEVMVDEGFKAVFLHTHHIATVYPQGEVSVNTATLRDWPTRTTMSRLRALGVDVCTRKGEVMLNGSAI